MLCRVLAVSRSAYYRWSVRRKYLEELHNTRENLKERLLEAFVANRRIYGAPRLTHELRDSGINVSRATVSRLMAELSITGACGRAKTITTRPDRHARKSSDLVERNFSVDETDKLWVSDLTYIGTREGWLYLVCIMDACSRRILGYSMSDSMDTQMFIDCLDKARSTRGKVLMSDTIFHSDHGSQYSSNEFRELLRLSQFSQSMGSVGDSYDNAMAEALWASLKKELVYQTVFDTREQARIEIFDWIQWYNRRRRHSSLGDISPIEFENSLMAEAA